MNEYAVMPTIHVVSYTGHTTPMVAFWTERQAKAFISSLVSKYQDTVEEDYTITQLGLPNLGMAILEKLAEIGLRPMNMWRAVEQMADKPSTGPGEDVLRSYLTWPVGDGLLDMFDLLEHPARLQDINLPLEELEGDVDSYLLGIFDGHNIYNPASDWSSDSSRAWP